MVPATLKRQMKDWKTADIESVYDFAKGQLAVNRKEMLPFVVELSQVMFANNQQYEDGHDEELDTTDSITDIIMSTVEMIILPHLEVLDIIQQ
ncbi:hypothetical protein F0342_03825 [Bacillus sp. CH30_1T]|jgi:hypothetical protein|uniref:hypothetical protein n=1 Tax=Bacillus sp. CH30_1T TaxID=2604836 RepID=UPI0011ED0910|nr:hypothetical protein [Bacillus sp. CH30_1T]KAA0565826.1 hypothetical protein F0342_03825 [Bacillus sp. CH30_1T]